MLKFMEEGETGRASIEIDVGAGHLEPLIGKFLLLSRNFIKLAREVQNKGRVV